MGYGDKPGSGGGGSAVFVPAPVGPGDILYSPDGAVWAPNAQGLPDVNDTLLWDGAVWQPGTQLPEGAQNFLIQADWFVNSATGDDTNDGATALTPLLTLRELARRWAGRTFSNLATVTINLAGTFPTQYLVLSDVTFVDPATVITVQGTMTQTDSGSLTAAFTAWNGAVRGALTDAAQDFTASVLRRIRMTSGAANGAVSNVASLGAGVTIANVGQFTTSTPSTVNPANGDTYVIETYDTQCAGYYIHINGPATLRVKDIDFITPVGSTARNYAECGGNLNKCIFFGCRFNATNGGTTWDGAARYAGISIEGNFGSFFGGNPNLINSVVFGFLQFSAANATSQAVLHEGGGARAANMFVSNGTLLETIGGTGNFGHAFFGVINGTGTALVTVEDLAQWAMTNAAGAMVGATGNTTTNALRVRNGCGVSYVTKPSATGNVPGEDVVLASAVAIAWATVPAMATPPDNAYVNVRQ